VLSRTGSSWWTVNVEEDIWDQNRRPQSYTQARPAFSATSGVLREASLPDLHSLNPSNFTLPRTRDAALAAVLVKKFDGGVAPQARTRRSESRVRRSDYRCGSLLQAGARNCRLPTVDQLSEVYGIRRRQTKYLQVRDTTNEEHPMVLSTKKDGWNI